MCRWLLLFAALVIGFDARAAELRLVTGELPPYCYHQPSPQVTAIGERLGEPQGLVYDVVREMASRVGHSGRIDFMPWIRAQELAQKGPDVGILALTRSPEREALYRWVANIYTDDLLVVGGPGVDVSALTNVKDRPIGVLRASGAEQLLQNLGFKRIEPRPEDWLNALELKDRHIDAWLAPRLMILYAYREVGGDASALNFGAIVRRSEIFLAMSKDVSDPVVAAWQQAFDQVKADGTFERILQKYRRAKAVPLPEAILEAQPFDLGY